LECINGTKPPPDPHLHSKNILASPFRFFNDSNFPLAFLEVLVH
jgi:hypothetical protein